MRFVWKFLPRLSVCAALLTHTVFAQTVPASTPLPEPLPESLPEPLTLEFALQQAEAGHPAFITALSRKEVAQARSRQVRADGRPGLELEARARWIDAPPAVAHLGNEDHRAAVVLSQSLYDFGGRKNRYRAAQSAVEASEWALMDVRQQRRLAIMRAYFDVILADLRYARSNEDMAIAFIRYDRARERQELGQRSDVDVLALESAYFRVRRQRFEDEYRRRETRAELALAINRPGELSSRLKTPALPASKPLPELEQLQAQAERNNALLRAARAKVEGLTAQLAAVRAERYPDIRLGARAAWYQRELSSSNPLAAELGFSMPLDLAGRSAARMAEIGAQLQGARAEQEQLRRRIGQRLLSLWLELENLRFRAQESDKIAEYRELYLDRARALYEMEVTTDLGDAMVALSDAAIGVAATEFRKQIILETIQMLTGGPTTENRL